LPRAFYQSGGLFALAMCFGGLRFANEGGALGPDLTMLSGRYSVRDFLDKVLNPNKYISDQYAATVFNLKDGRVVTGRVVNLQGEGMSIQTDMLSPARLTRVNVSQVDSQRLSEVSVMPAGLLNTFQSDEVLDLMACVLSRGDRTNPMSQQPGNANGWGKDPGAAPPQPGADGFISIFNGKDLTGWEGLDGYWSVKDGVLQGSETRENSK